LFKIFRNKVLIITLVLTQLISFSDLKSFAETNDKKPEINGAVSPQKVLAVADFTNDTGDSSMDYLKKGLANSLVTSLGMNPKSNFSIVERGQFESLVKEMGLTESGLVDVNNATKIGSALGASQIIVGGLVKLGTSLRLNVRVIDVKTSRLLLAFSEYADSEGDVLKQLDKVADKIVAGLSPNNNLPANNITGLKIEDPQPQQGVPLWMWITGGAIVTAAAIIIAIFVAKKATNTTTTKTPTTTPTVRPILRK
jgi:TolB-like protein